MARNITVNSLFDCNYLEKQYADTFVGNPSKRQNMIGCLLIRIIRDMYNFNVTYKIGPASLYNNKTIDVYATLHVMNKEVLAIANPVHTVLMLRFGFIYRASHNLEFFYWYYCRPFTNSVWNCLLAVAGLVAIIFFLVSWWEKRLIGGPVENSLGLEVLLVLGGYFQHVFPVETVLCSRRAAHFTYFLYSYIIYTVYTSNLLSHLVNDKEHDLSLADLLNSNYELATFSAMKRTLDCEYTRDNMSDFHEKLLDIKEMGIYDGLEAVRSTRTAFLTDYRYIYPIIKKQFSDDEICSLMRIDIASDVRKYIFAAKNFPYLEELKIGILRAKEAGIIRRMTSYDLFHRNILCDSTPHQEVGIHHIFALLVTFLAFVVLSVIIMVMEMVHYEKNRVWPYVD